VLLRPVPSRTGRMMFCCKPSHGGWENRDILQKDVVDVGEWLRDHTRPVLFVPVASMPCAITN